jgi:O-antigen/teichoic acid export membrane protein
MRSMGAVAGATIAAAGVYVAVVTGLLIAGRASISLVVAGAALGQVMGTWIAWRSRPRHLGPVKECFLDWRRYRRALAFGAPGGVGEVVLFAMLRVDVLIVAAFLPLEAVGLYAVAAALTEVLFVVPDGVALVVLPTSARDPGSARIPHVLAVTAVVTGLGGLLLVALDRTVIDLLFGKAFVGAASAVPLLVVAAVAGGAWKVIGAEVVARGRTSPRLWSAGAGLVTMVLVDLVAIPRLGIVGAALGSACGYVAAAALLARSWLLRSRVVARPPARVAGYAAVGAATGVR